MGFVFYLGLLAVVCLSASVAIVTPGKVIICFSLTMLGNEFSKKIDIAFVSSFLYRNHGVRLPVHRNYMKMYANFHYY